ncbi:MAG: hypothetical protein U0931_28215 [Vulcanimicrobiota bacterium]
MMQIFLTAASRSSRSGTTLLELLISMSVLFMVFAGVAAILVQGLTYLRANQSALDAQRAAILAVNSITREAEHTRMAYATLEIDGLTFADPYGGHDDPSKGIVSGLKVDSLGQLLWQRYICYYRDPAKNQLIRKEVTWDMCPEVASSPPVPFVPQPSGTYTCGPPIDPAHPNCRAYFLASTVPSRMVASDCCAFNATNHLDSNLHVSAIKVSFDFGDPDPRNYNHYWFEISTVISPRN